MITVWVGSDVTSADRVTAAPSCCRIEATLAARPGWPVPLSTVTRTSRAGSRGGLRGLISATGTRASSRNAWKMRLSSGWVHITLARSSGSTRERG